ncbi:MAG: chloride channel protein, partial [Bacteroidota bacterium]
LVYILIVLLLKAIAAAVTIACGGSGGTFAPSLFLGAVLGFAFAKFVNLTGLATISESNFALVGMCGVLAGAQHAPLTAIFLIAELTGSYVLFLPLMAVSALSLGTVTYFVKHSIYTQDLLDHGNLLNQNLSLSHLRIDSLIETNYQFISPESPVQELKKIIPESHYDIYPVLDQKERLMGIVTLNDVRGLLFNGQADLDQEIKQVMGQPPTFLRFGENLESALLKFERTGADHLPVMRDGKYGGFVTKTDLYVFYREKLLAQSEEEEL